MREKINHSSRGHALLSASSSARWLKCPPSAVAATMYPNTSTEYTQEGTLAHEVAEYTARSGVYHLDEDGQQEGVTQEMIECAKAYADYLQELITDDNAVVLLEQRLDFSPWVPDGFGTGDAIIIQGHRLDVIDYKYGKGVAVSAVDNSQMKLYALGALNDFGDIYDIHEIGMHIFQPRINNVSADVLRVDHLLKWGQAIKSIAELAAKGQGDFCSGEHCRFCPHAGSCPTLAGDCMRVVNLHGDKAMIPHLLPWMIAEILKMEPMISSWIKAVKDRALTQLLNGERIPGYKVVEGRGSREWGEEHEVARVLEMSGYGYAEITETKILSPAAMEKSIGKKKVAELVGALIVSKPGSPTIAPESDKRKPFDRLAEAQKDFQ